MLESARLERGREVMNRYVPAAIALALGAIAGVSVWAQMKPEDDAVLISQSIDELRRTRV